MIPNNNDNHAVQHIVLPSGRSIEVVRFNETAKELRQLHICPLCASNLVQPVAWSPEPKGRWYLTLECPNCGWAEEGIYERSQVESLEDTLDDGLCKLIADLQRLVHANMAEDVERFVSALTADQILPEDF
jgi:formate dehydrogenase maturation protein FdhE